MKFCLFVLIFFYLCCMSCSKDITIRGNSMIGKIVEKVSNGKCETITIGHTIYYAGNVEELSPSTIRHELCHVKQYEKYGTLEFIKRYIFYSIVYGYWDNPFEVEATKEE